MYDINSPKSGKKVSSVKECLTEIVFRLRLPVLLTKVVGLFTLTGKLYRFPS